MQRTAQEKRRKWIGIAGISESERLVFGTSGQKGALAKASEIKIARCIISNNMKYTNDRLDKALDRLYDVLSKSPEGTGYKLRMERLKRHGVRIPTNDDSIRETRLLDSSPNAVKSAKTKIPLR